jgi:hypothetical protein
MTEIKYRFNGSTHTFTVESERAGWNPDVAREYAQYDAVDRYGYEIDVNNVELVRMGEPHSNYDETGGVPL